MEKSNSQLRFSLITCTRNNSKWLPKHLESVRNQTFKNFEHIIVDDASTDKSIEVIRSELLHPNSKVFAREVRAFAVKNHLLAMKNCSGEIIVHLDGDDWFYDNEVLEFLNSVYEKTNCLATYGSWVHYDKAQTWGMGKFPGSNASEIRSKKLWAFTHLRSFKRELIAAIPAMDIVDSIGEIHKYAYDVSLLTGIYEVAMQKNRLVYISKPMVVYNSNTGENDHTLAVNEQVGTAYQIYNSPYSMLKLL